jgi:hypothetical protein
MTYRIREGRNYVGVLSPGGPYDRGLGYASLPSLSQRLQETNFPVEKMAWPSEPMRAWCALGLFPPYREKSQAGLKILDRHGKIFFCETYPRRIFNSFSEVPRIIVDMLLFIENRKLLDPGRPSDSA